MINMGVIQAKAEKMGNDELKKYIKSLELNDDQLEQLKSHLKLVRFLKARK